MDSMVGNDIVQLASRIGPQSQRYVSFRNMPFRKAARPEGVPAAPVPADSPPPAPAVPMAVEAAPPLAAPAPMVAVAPVAAPVATPPVAMAAPAARPAALRLPLIEAALAEVGGAPAPPRPPGSTLDRLRAGAA
jgi:hypothetical protein